MINKARLYYSLVVGALLWGGELCGYVSYRYHMANGDI